MNIPIYRAKEIDSNEFVEGYLVRGNNDCGKEALFIQDDDFWHEHQIDPATLAIRFPNMIDKNGKKIFASLSEDGVGGDELDIHVFTLELGEHMGAVEGENEFQAIAIFDEYGIGLINGDKKEFLFCYSGLHEESIEVIGIKDKQ